MKQNSHCFMTEKYQGSLLQEKITNQYTVFCSSPFYVNNFGMLQCILCNNKKVHSPVVTFIEYEQTLGEV